MDTSPIIEDSLSTLAGLREGQTLTLIDGGVVPQIFNKLGHTPQSWQTQLETDLSSRAKVYGGSQPGLGRTMTDVLRRAEKEADKMRDDYVSTEHLLLALSEVIKDLPFDRNTLMQALNQVRGSQRVTNQNPETTYEALAKYGRKYLAFGRRSQRANERFQRPGQRF